MIQVRTYAKQRTGPDMGLVHIAIGDIYRERNQLSEAKASYETGINLCRPFEAWRAAVTSGVIGTAHILAAEGRTDEAIEALLEIEKHAVDALDTGYIRSNLSRLYLAGKSYDDAARWAIDRGIPALEEGEYVQEFEALTIVRILLAQALLEAQGTRVMRVSTDPLGQADDLLAYVDQAAISGGRMARIVESAVLRALLLAARQESSGALKQLQEALSLAEPENYVRLFVDEGRPMYQLLMTLRTRPISSSISADYLNTIRDAFPLSVRQSVSQGSLTGVKLTKSESNTLRLLASERSIEEIAAELSVAVSTVRTYSKRIYSKLDAHSRAEAVYRARELNLI
jgi:LuxR family maltose regulon positive regulatory protein